MQLCVIVYMHPCYNISVQTVLTVLPGQTSHKVQIVPLPPSSKYEPNIQTLIQGYHSHIDYYIDLQYQATL